jgi:phosphomannomutase / phosphoglucomutase
MTKINPHIFRAYDIRGIAQQAQKGKADSVPKTSDSESPTNKKGTTDSTPHTPIDLTEKTVYLIGKGTATYLIRKYASRHMAVGRDVRLTSPALQKAFIKGITECGMKATDIGLSPSPTVYFATCSPDLDFDCATNITASHNPKEYNGIKTVAKGAHSICGDELQEILKLIEANDFETPDKPEPNQPDQLKPISIWPTHFKELTDLVPKLARPLKVVIDAGNGAAGPFAPELLRKIGAEVIELFCEPDGNFPNHEANPEELHNMTDLIHKVQETKADLGIGFDGDGDRVGIIDEKGNHYSADYLLLLLTKDLLTRQSNPKIVFDVKVSQAIINKMEELGAEPIMSKTGHSFIEKRMKELSAPLGGEVSGHMFFGENYYGFDDALLASAKILQVLANQALPFSQLFDDLPETHMTPEFKAHCPDDKKFPVIAQLTKHFTSLYDCITIDGVRVVFNETDWGAIRASNTSPNLTLRFEAKSEARLAEIQKIFLEEIKKHPEVDTSWYKF